MKKGTETLSKEGKALRSIHTGRDASHYDADQIWFIGISAMRTHRVFS